MREVLGGTQMWHSHEWGAQMTASYTSLDMAKASYPEMQVVQ